MSRYGIEVTIRNADPTRPRQIEEAASREWPFKDWTATPEGRIWSTAEGRLRDSETEEAFVNRLARAIWTANRGYCNVEIAATCLEDVPCRAYLFGRIDYKRAMTARGNSTTTAAENAYVDVSGGRGLKLFHAFEVATDHSSTTHVNLSQHVADQHLAHAVKMAGNGLDTYAVGTVEAGSVEEALDLLRQGKWDFSQRC
jgi:hypothetical protein